MVVSLTSIDTGRVANHPSLRGCCASHRNPDALFTRHEPWRAIADNRTDGLRAGPAERAKKP